MRRIYKVRWHLTEIIQKYIRPTSIALRKYDMLINEQTIKEEYNTRVKYSSIVFVWLSVR